MTASHARRSSGLITGKHRLVKVLTALLITALYLTAPRLNYSAAPSLEVSDANQPVLSLEGNAATGYLKQQGLYSSLQEALAASRYKAEWQAQTAVAGLQSAYELKNPAHNMRAYLTSNELQIASLSDEPQGSWHLGMKLSGCGYGDSLSSITPGEIKARENRVEIQKSAIGNQQSAITEWYVNSERGIEQGFDIPAPPSGKSKGAPLRLTLELTGNLEARLDDAKQAITFTNCSASLVYGELEAFDARGKRLTAQMELKPSRVTLVIDDSGAEYPVKIDPLLTQLVKLTASDGASGDVFGTSVAMSGDTMVIGAPGDDVGFNEQGSAYVVIRSATGWTQQQKVTASDGAASDEFGHSVAINGDTIVVGAVGDDGGKGSAYVFVRSGITWTQQQKLTASDGAASDNFGFSVAISGDSVVVSAFGDDGGKGSAYVFVRSGTAWTQQQKLTASDGASVDNFGISVAITADTVVIGAFRDDVGFNDQGSAYVFARSGTAWTQQQKLTASDGASGDQFGNSVAISVDTVVVGAIGGDNTKGSAYVFVRTGLIWIQQQKLSASDGASLDEFGSSVAISGDTAVVGAFFDDLGFIDQGSAYVFVRSGTIWTQQQKLVAGDGAGSDQFGTSIAISGETVVIGAFRDDSFQGSAYVFSCGRTNHAQLIASDGAATDNLGQSIAVSGDTVVVGAYLDDVGFTDQGSAYVFIRSGSTWTQQQKLTAGDGAANDYFGFSVAIGGDTVVIGAPLDDVGFTDQGSAYVFVRSGSTWTQQQKIIAGDGAAADVFGYSVAIGGDTVIVGAVLDDVGFTDQGSGYVFLRSGVTWTQQAKLTAGDGALNDNFGSSVGISGNTVVVGAFLDNVGGFADQGSAYIFVRSGTVWSQQTQLTAGDGAPSDQFGFSAAVSGDSVVVGANGDDVGGNSDQGSAYVFIRNGTIWTQQQQIAASDGGPSDFFGASVTISGDTVAVGAAFDDIGTNVNQGSVYVFIRFNTRWQQQQQLSAPDGSDGDQFGNAVGASGDTVVVGAFANDALGNPAAVVDQGSAYVFFGACNTAPAIAAASGFSRQQGSPATLATLATVSDFQEAAGSLTVTATSLPSGVTLSSLTNNSGSITAIVGAGCNAQSGAQNITLQVADSNGATSTTNVAVNVSANTSASLGVYPASSVSTGGSATITPSATPADNGSISFAVSIPNYLGSFTFNPVTGVLSISNASPQGIYPVTITATDNCGFITTTAFSLTVGAVITVNPVTLPTGFVSVGYNQTLTATGGTAPYTFAVTSGTLPPGLTLSSGGVLAGTPTNGGNFSFTVRATDNSAAHDTGTRTYSMVISGPTTINLISLEATSYDDGVLIIWQTGREVNNLGFNLHRDEGGMPGFVNSQLIAGSALIVGQGVELGSGYSYKWWDAKPAAPATRYWIEDVDLNGQSRWNGPFYPAQPIGKQRPASVQQAKTLAGLSFTEAPSARVESRAALLPSGVAQAQVQAIINASSGSVKFGVKRESWYRVTRQELIAAGLDPSVDPRNLQLFVDAKQQAISVTGQDDGHLDPEDSLEFYGTGIESPFSELRTYYLLAGTQAGLRVPSINSPAHPSPSGSFELTVERREHMIYFAALRNGDKENFFGAVVVGQPVNQTLTLNHLAPSAVPATLTVALQGVTNPSHLVSVRLNGSDLGQLVFQGQSEGSSSFSVSSELLREGVNQITLIPQGGPSDVSLVDFMRLTYSHSLTADDDMLKAQTGGGEQLTIDGFTSDAIRVYDVTDPYAAQEVNGYISKHESGSFSVSLVVPGTGRRSLLALTDDRTASALKVAQDSSSNLRGLLQGADLLIITRRELFDSVQELKELRQRQGISVSVVDIEDVYDEFSFGQKTPQAVKDFVQFAMSQWKKPIKYVLLFGDASYDPKSYFGLAEVDLVPTRLIDTTFMETASDDWLADFNNDGIADIAVGRLPVSNVSEARLIVKKIISYEQSARSEEALLVSDLNDGIDFESATEQLIPLIPGESRVTHVRRGQLGDAAARAVLIDAMNRGQRIVNYSGHGSINVWRGGLLSSSDALQLQNAEHLSVFAIMNCLNGYFQDPVSDSLGEALLKSNGGAVAVWASSAMTFAEGQAPMNQEFFRQVFASSRVRLGDAAIRAKAATFDIEARRTWVLLGDPTTRMR